MLKFNRQKTVEIGSPVDNFIKLYRQWSNEVNEHTLTNARSYAFEKKISRAWSILSQEEKNTATVLLAREGLIPREIEEIMLTFNGNAVTLLAQPWKGENEKNEKEKEK